MIKLPDFERAFDYENFFYLSCDTQRISKILAHYELFKMVLDIPGAIIECGVFKGMSLVRFAMFRELLSNPYSKKIIAFDTFGPFPESSFEDDKQIRNRFIKEAGGQSISVEQMKQVLAFKRCEQSVELVAGDICKTIPEYITQNPQLKISLLNLDADLYEPSVTALKYLYPRIEKGGVVILDNYGIFPGETKAVEEYFKDMSVQILKFPFAMSPHYLVKG